MYDEIDFETSSLCLRIELDLLTKITLVFNDGLRKAFTRVHLRDCKAHVNMEFLIALVCLSGRRSTELHLIESSRPAPMRDELHIMLLAR